MNSSSATSSRRLDFQITSHPANVAAVRKAIEAFAVDHQFADPETAEVGLCVNEALANIIRHAYHGQSNRSIHVQAWMEADVLIVTLRDWGNGIDPACCPTRAYDPLEPGGLGLICLRHCLESVAYTPQPDGMLTTLKRRKRR